MTATTSAAHHREGRRAQRTAAGLILGLVAGLCLSACGGGAPDTGGESIAQRSGSAPTIQALSISTASLPAGRPQQAYPSFTLTAKGAALPVSWSVISGSLPAGMALTPGGQLAGTPEASGVSTFAVRATSGDLSAERTYGLAVGAFGVVVTDGLLAGTAWTDVPVSLSCVGASGDVRFEIIAAGSGGGLAQTSGTAGTAQWRPGTTGGGAIDTLRAIDVTSGARADVSFPVQVDPTAGFAAEFGRSDVWYVDTSRKLGTHPYATDLHEALALAGLRSPKSTDRAGTLADRLAETCVRAALLSNLSRFYLRNPDGSRGAGLPISFPWTEPTSGSRATDGGWIAGGADRYSLIGVVHGSNPGVIGTALTDGLANGSHESDVTGSGSGELGVFLNRFIETVNYGWNNLQLTWDPVGLADVPALEALLYGLPNPGGRYATLQNGVHAVGLSLATVVAHEIGHSLGLGHTSPRVPGSLMNSAGVFAPGIEYGFTPEAIAQLRTALPGLGRGSAAAKYSVASAGPEGGIATCGERERCNLVLEQAPPRAPCHCTAHRRAHSTPGAR